MFLADRKVIEKLTSPQFPTVRIGNYNFSDMRAPRPQLRIEVILFLQAKESSLMNEFELDRRVMQFALGDAD
jgi:hypothetical protein